MVENFNYISFGNWECLEGEEIDFQMSKGRMFEYTQLDTAKRLEGFDGSSFDFLESLPTFMCSEIERSDGIVSMFVKYGHVKNASAEKKEISAKFTTSIDFGKLDFLDIAEASETLGVDDFQLYRTHWAVREGDARDVLRRLAEVHPSYAAKIAQHLAPDHHTVTAEPPPLAKNIIGIAKSVDDFLSLLYSHPPESETETFFRGHEDAKFELTPSVLRKSPKGSWKYMQIEDRLCKELLISHYDEFQNDHYCFDRLVRMQHYGLPTRLLDISSNPLVALFFACYGREETMALDGEVIIFHIKSETIKYYDSDTVSCLANISNLTNEQKNQIDVNMDIVSFNRTDVIGKLLHHIRSEKGYFDARIIPDDLGSIVCVKAKRTNTRIKSQAGAFLLFGHEATLPESGDYSTKIARINIQNKRHILDQLDRININATTVYPSINQTASHLSARYIQTDETP